LAQVILAQGLKFPCPCGLFPFASMETTVSDFARTLNNVHSILGLLNSTIDRLGERHNAELTRVAAGTACPSACDGACGTCAGEGSERESPSQVDEAPGMGAGDRRSGPHNVSACERFEPKMNAWRDVSPPDSNVPLPIAAGVLAKTPDRFRWNDATQNRMQAMKQAMITVDFPNTSLDNISNESDDSMPMSSVEVSSCQLPAQANPTDMHGNQKQSESKVFSCQRGPPTNPMAMHESPMPPESKAGWSDQVVSVAPGTQKRRSSLLSPSQPPRKHGSKKVSALDTSVELDLPRNTRWSEKRSSIDTCASSDSRVSVGRQMSSCSIMSSRSSLRERVNHQIYDESRDVLVPNEWDHQSRSAIARARWKRAIIRAKFMVKLNKVRCLPQERGLQHDEEEPFFFWLLPCWVESRKTTRRTMTSVTQSSAWDRLLRDSHDGLENLHLPRWWDRLIISPHCMGRIGWDMMGCILFCYDAVMIPLTFFALPQQSYFQIMGWIIRCYWTADIPLSFFTGKDMGSKVEMRLSKIAKTYATGWLPIDMVLVFIEWMEILGESRQEFGIARLGKMARNLRILRMFRFLKLMKTVNLPDSLKRLAYIRSEKLMIMFGIMQIMAAVVWVTHFIACFWYGIAKGSAGGKNWVDEDGFSDSSPGYAYLASFHWSLTQFTGTTNIEAHNALERFFSVVVLLVAFVITAFAVSSITTSMTRLQIVTAEASTQFADLRKYMSGVGLSKALALRITNSARSAMEQASKNVPEESVVLLKLVTEPLKIELHYEVNMPALTVHPFFHYYDAKCHAAMRQICHCGVSKLKLHRGDLLFSCGEMPDDPQMFFVIDGRLLYLHKDLFAYNVDKGQWMCEAVLWTLWCYHGTMKAKGDTMLLLVDSAKFQRIVCQFLNKDESNPISYGQQFVRYMNSSNRHDLTDIHDAKFSVEAVAKDVFGHLCRRQSVMFFPSDCS